MAEILLVVGARPNFVKVAPVLHALEGATGVRAAVLHTGQHYDHALAGAFLEQLRFPQPDYFLGVGSGTHAAQTAGVLTGVEAILLGHRYDAIVVPGDVNSTLAAALAASKLGVPVVHLEAGLRSGDWSMPEEVNRVLTDRLSSLLLTHSPEAEDHLRAEGVPLERVRMVGNTMIDSLYALLDRVDADEVLCRRGVERGGFVLVTLHRPALVDDPECLDAVLDVLGEITLRMPVLFPVHPRTAARLGERGAFSALRLLEPLEYTEFIALEAAARLVVTDSGGVQEETSALGVPCLTYRTTTERPVTVEQGTNRLIGVDPETLRSAAAQALDAPAPTERPVIPGWDGAAGPRAAAAILDLLG